MTTDQRAGAPKGWPGPGSPYHRGEQTAQELAGVRETAERIGRKMIRDAMSDQHRTFFAELPFLIVGSVDNDGWPWASIVTGTPGFASSPDPKRLQVRARHVPGDPLGENLRAGAPVGVLGIQPETRRRNRMNGRIAEAGETGFTIEVDQSFGNCPKYIHARKPEVTDEGSTRSTPDEIRKENRHLSPDAQALIAAADTFFIATASPGSTAGAPANGADVNHRGGRSGFVRVEEMDGATVLTVPDFSGNNAFATFGNIMLNPRAGLLFIDFDKGDILSLTCTAEILWDDPAIAAFQGAQRFLRLTIHHGVFSLGALRLRWSAPEPASQLAATGRWDDIKLE